jgi:nucleoside-diphosphate-sugar epimerase
MNVLVIGASGYVGGGIVRALLAHGHTVFGTARSVEARVAVKQLGAVPVDADARRPETLAAAAIATDAVIFAVQLQGEDTVEAERAALRAVIDALADSGKPFIYTSGVWYYGPTSTPAAEDAPANPPALVASRPETERLVLDAVKRGVRAMIIRPGVVYGHFSGIPMMLVGSAKENGAALYVGDGANHWPLVHVDDLGELFMLALEKGKPGDVFNAADESVLTVREIAEAASRFAGAGGKAAAWPLEAAREALGPFADCLAMDQLISSKKAAGLGWKPRSTTLVEEFERT